jgi:hypothetical protein
MQIMSSQISVDCSPGWFRLQSVTVMGMPARVCGCFSVRGDSAAWGHISLEEEGA